MKSSVTLVTPALQSIGLPPMPPEGEPEAWQVDQQIGSLRQSLEAEGKQIYCSPAAVKRNKVDVQQTYSNEENLGLQYSCNKLYFILLGYISINCSNLVIQLH